VRSRCDGLDESDCERADVCIARYGSPPGTGEQVYAGCDFDPEQDGPLPDCELQELCATPNDGGGCLSFGLGCSALRLPRGWTAQPCDSGACAP
jgi:hypothetical protein